MELEGTVYGGGLFREVRSGKSFLRIAGFGCRNIRLFAAGIRADLKRLRSTEWGSERYALEKGFPGLRVSDAETLSLQKSAKSRTQNTELAALRQLYFGS